jgi:hypothetical protein
MKRDRALTLFLAEAIVVGLLPVLALAASPTQLQTAAKIDLELLDQIAVAGRASFWIRMAGQADLSAAYDMDWSARGWYAYQTLAATARESQAEVIAYLKAQGLSYESFWIDNSIYVRDGGMATVQSLAVRGDVARLKADATLYLPDPPPDERAGVEGSYDDWGLTWVHAPDVWALGYDGSGIVVANIDTGVQYGHPQLSGTYRGTLDGSHQYNWCDPSDICPGDAPCDNNGHGTHVMGTLSGENDDPAVNPNIIGMAPGSTWMACKGCEGTQCSLFALTECAQWIAAPTEVMSGSCGTTGTPNPDKRPNIVNNSWGDVTSDPWYRSYVQSWRAFGIFPAFSAGNSNTCASVGSPGDYPESFSSANHQSNGVIHPSYSSRGPSSFGSTPYCKPNIAAPGSGICSSVPWNLYTCSYTGTSMASPHSAGAVALLWQACPALIGQIDLTFQTLQNSAAPPPADPCAATAGCADLGCNCTYGYGYLDVYTAVQSCIAGASTSHMDGYVLDRGSHAPLDAATVTVSPGLAAGSSIEASTDPSGYYTMTLAPGTYNVVASKDGYVPDTVTGVVVVTNTVTHLDFNLAFVGLWTAGPSDAPFQYNRFDGVFNPHDNLIYFPGGRTGSTHDRSIWTYDPVNDLWADTGCDMNHRAANYTAALVEDDGTGRGEALYLVGGYDVNAGAYIDTVQRYYPSQPGCAVEDVTTDPYPDAVNGQIVGAMGVAVVSDKVYTFGGWETTTAPYFSDKTWQFDPRALAGSRWTQITAATLQPGRSYINVAVQGGLIYAMGGVSYYDTTPSLDPTDVVEVFDPAQPAAGWVALTSLPLATAEGRGFGFQADARADTQAVQQAAGKIYVVGGGDWPDASAEVLEYDVASDTWDQAFPYLLAARRDHAGVYVSLCTPDPVDGLPGMWVFGGRTTSDDPPYGDPEFFPLPCAPSNTYFTYLPVISKDQ